MGMQCIISESVTRKRRVTVGRATHLYALETHDGQVALPIPKQQRKV